MCLSLVGSDKDLVALYVPEYMIASGENVIQGRRALASRLGCSRYMRMGLGMIYHKLKCFTHTFYAQ